VSRSVVVVNKQYQLMKEGHSEQAALQLAQKAVEDEERKTLEQVSRLIIDNHQIYGYRERPFWRLRTWIGMTRFIQPGLLDPERSHWGADDSFLSEPRLCCMF
jgi:hypothetical protein